MGAPDLKPRWAGVSTLAVLAATVVAPSPAEACTALAVGGTTSVEVTCSAGDRSDLFLTSYSYVIVEPSPSPGLPGGETTVTYDGNGDDVIIINGGEIADNLDAPPPILQNAGSDLLATLDANDDVIQTLGGNDRVTMTGGSLLGGIEMGAGGDVFEISGGTISGSILGDDATSVGNDRFTVSGGSIGGSIFAGGGNDVVAISGGAQIGAAPGQEDSVGLEDGDDQFSMTGGTLSGDVSGGADNDDLAISAGSVGGFVAGNEGDDVIAISGGTIGDDVRGNEGVDRVTVSGGTIAGDVEGETVTLTGGSIGGDIVGISADTLTINASNLTLRNGVLFSGTSAVGTITGTTLADGGFAQNFAGFTSLALQNGSMLRFAGGSQGIGGLAASGGSTLFVSGTSTLDAPGGGLGNLSLANATLSFVNGVTGDTLNVGNLTLNGGTLAIDVNAEQGLSDFVTAAGSFSAAGSNTVTVNLLGALNLAGPTVIAIAPVAGEVAPTGGAASALFTIAGLPANPGSLFDFTVITGPDGGLYLFAAPNNLALPLATRAAIDSRPVEVVVAAVNDILNDAVLTRFGVLVSAARSEAAPGFGIFASGQLAGVNHDGFEVGGGGFSGVTPGFDATDFSLAASVELDAAQYFGFDQNYGLDLGLYGGYATTEIDMDSTDLFPQVGEGENRSGMVGGYGLFRSGQTYLLSSVTGFFGNTDIDNFVLNSTGDYNTAGIAVTGTAGHIFALTDTWRFDLRGGVLGASFRGDDFTDSQGNRFGDSRVSFGAVKFEPGLFAQYVLENNKIFSPYVRAEFQQRFGYRNESSLDDIDFEFEDSDFSASLSAGANYKFAEAWTASAEVRGKFSADSQTLGGKLGIKAKF